MISVRVIADLEFRLQAAQRQQNLGRKDALTSIEKVDKERRAWTRFLFEVDWDDPHLYDLVLNLSRTSMTTACETVAQLTKRAEFQPTPPPVKALEDLTLHSQVSAALATDFGTRDAELTVTADAGMVTITGGSRWPEVANAVPVVVCQVDGVKGINCEITGATPPSPLT